MSLLNRRRALMFNLNSMLPSSYQQVEYIESTGTQWINTGFIPNQDTRVICDFQFTDTSATFLFGTRRTAALDGYTFNISGTPKFVSAYGTSGNAGVSDPDTSRHIVDKNKRRTYLDNVLKVTAAEQSFTCVGSLELFACCNNVTKGYLPSKARIFSCVIYDNDVKVRDFIPCYRKSDRVVGLFDLVNREFYTNSGTGEFTARYTDKISNYNIVDYIESTGTQYINTGITPTEATTIESKFQLTKIGANYPFGVRTTSQKEICYVSGGASVWNFRYGLQSNCTYGTTDMNVHTIKMGIGGIYWDNELVEFPDISPFTCMGNLYLFALNDNGSISYGKSRIFNFKIYQNDMLIRNYIPCSRKSDGVLGLFETINNYFYENMGTGEFIKQESLLPQEYKEVKYLQSTGEQFINTGIMSASNVDFDIEMQLVDTSEDLQRILGGYDSTTLRYELYVSLNRGISFNYCNITYYSDIKPESNTTLIIAKQGANLCINENVKIPITSASFYGDKEIYLFASSREGTKGAIAKVYKAKIYEDGILVRDLVPCYRKSDNVVGMYDVVNDEFYTNSGTGEFIQGGEV